MKTHARFLFPGTHVSSALAVGVIAALVVSASAEQPKRARADARPALTAAAKKSAAQRVYYAYSSTSGIPVPMDRLGTIPTTAIPLTVIGNVNSFSR